jgi:hypothetical protein
MNYPVLVNSGKPSQRIISIRFYETETAAKIAPEGPI